jgi:hypothetical protein
LPDSIFAYQKSPLNWKCWNILCQLGIFYDHLEYFMIIWNILWSSGTYILWYRGLLYVCRFLYSPVLVCCTKKNLAALVHMYWCDNDILIWNQDFFNHWRTSFAYLIIIFNANHFLDIRC